MSKKTNSKTKAKSKTINANDVLVDQPAATRVNASSLENGALYKNEEFVNDNDPDYKGTLQFTEPGAYWLEGFMKKNEAGAIYMSLRAKRNEQQSDDIDEQNQDRGVLYRNNRKRLRTHADYTGSFNVSAPGEYAIQGVIATSKGGNHYMGLEIVIADVAISEDEMPF